MASSFPLHPGLKARAADQRGVFTAAQAYVFGHTEKEIQRLRAGKYLVSVRRGVYAEADRWDGADPSQRLTLLIAALAQALTAPAVLSHQSAAAELGLDLLEPDNSVLHVTRPERSGTRLEAGVDHHVAELRDDDTVLVSAGVMPVTSMARTSMDVARDTHRFECAVTAFDSGLRAGVDAQLLRAELDRARSWPGARLASGALPMADGRAENPGESWSRVVLVGLGLAPLDLPGPLERCSRPHRVRRLRLGRGHRRVRRQGEIRDRCRR